MDLNGTQTIIAFLGGATIVPGDANGDLDGQIVASGASTFDCFLFCLGYWL